MKEKTLKALQVLFNITINNLGFLIACGIILVIILKLACV